MILRFSLLFVLIPCLLFAQGDFEIVKMRVLSDILKDGAGDDRTGRLILTMRADGSWPGIDYEDVSNTGFENQIHLANMLDISLAFCQESSRFYKDSLAGEVLSRALELWCDKDFICENWWHNQIGTPTSLVNVLLLMDEYLDTSVVARALPIIGRANLGASGARQGGDRIKVGGIEAKLRLVMGDEDGFREIMKVINKEIRFTTGDRGLQHDYSFHHRIDRVNTTYSYGGSYARIFAEWAAYVAGTEYAFSRERIGQLIDYYLDGICKQAVYGKYLEKGAMNRGISRKERFGPMSTDAPENLLEASGYRKVELEDIINLRRGESEPEMSFSRFYWQSEHFVCQRPDFFTSVRMYSVRNRNMEWPYNSEGLLNHHRGDGASFLSKKGNEYLNIWPVYDWQKIPGTTVLQKRTLPPPDEIQKEGVTEFVGAVTDGYYAAVAFDFISPHDQIKARKSWFFFDDAYVCLGAGIESESYHLPLVTTLDQNLLEGEVLVKDRSGVKTMERGEHEIRGASWVFHEGTAYLFPEPSDIHLYMREASGRWTDISKQSSSPKELIYKDVFKLWIDHGARPQGRKGGLVNTSMIPKDVSYQYIVIPSADPDRMDEDSGISILVNNRLLQAVSDNDSGMLMAIFYQGGELRLPGGHKLSIDSQGVVMLKIRDGEFKEISVSDPSRKLSRIHIKISGRDELAIDLPGGFYAGQSVSLEL